MTRFKYLGDFDKSIVQFYLGKKDILGVIDEKFRFTIGRVKIDVYQVPDNRF